MSKSMVKLRPSQQRALKFRHPLLDQASPPLKDEELDELIPRAFAGDQDAKDALIMGHLAMLRKTIGRYLFHWPVTRRFMEEMVSVGLYTLTRVVNKLTSEILRDRLVGPYLLNNVCKHVEIEIAKLRGIAPAPMRTNQRRVQQGEEPIFGEVVGNLTSAVIQAGCCYFEAGFEELDTLDVVEQLRLESHSCELLLNSEYWGLNDSEAAKLTGIPQQTVQWYRTKMLKRYQELTGDK